MTALALIVSGAFFGLAIVGADGTFTALWHDPYIARVVRFTLLQATLSTLLSIGLAIPLARAIDRRGSFLGRNLLLRLFALPLVLPSLAAVLGILAVFGGNGWLNRALALSGFNLGLSPYGISGILLAHVFFNLPLATRFLVQAWTTVPAETWRLAAQLDMDSRALFRVIEWPLLRRHVPGIAGLVFLLCMISFTTVLTLGGGPATTTIEIAIYQSLRFDFEPARATALALVQLALSLLVVAGWQSLMRAMPFEAGLARAARRPDATLPRAVAIDGLVMLLAVLFIGGPLVALLLYGLGIPLVQVLTEAATWRAFGLSLIVASAAALATMILAAGLLVLTRAWRADPRMRRFAPLAVAPGLLVLAVPPFVLGTGWFVLLRAVADPIRFGLGVVVTVNALMALPYALRLLDPVLAQLDDSHGKLSAALGIRGWNRFRLIDWPTLRHPLGLATGLALALSAGDLGAIALFGSRDAVTLPFLLYDRLGAYRQEEAAALALVLTALSLGLITLAERIIGGRPRA